MKLVGVREVKRMQRIELGSRLLAVGAPDRKRRKKDTHKQAHNTRDRDKAPVLLSMDSARKSPISHFNFDLYAEKDKKMQYSNISRTFYFYFNP